MKIKELLTELKGSSIIYDFYEKDESSFNVFITETNYDYDCSLDIDCENDTFKCYDRSYIYSRNELPIKDIYELETYLRNLI